MNRLYQWLYERAMSFRSHRAEGGITRRTEVTIHECERTTLLVARSATGDTTCPLCGQPVDRTGLADALHPIHSVPQALTPDSNNAPPLAGQTNDPQRPGSETLRVLPRRLR